MTVKIKAYELDQTPPDLKTLVAEAQEDGEILITEHQKPVAKLLPVVGVPHPHPKAGSLQGKVWMAADFNALLTDFKDYME